VLGYFEWQKKDYEKIPIDEQVEVLSLSGDIALDGARPKVHAHAVLGKRDGSAVGGHLLTATVRPPLEIVLTELPDPLCRRSDPETGLALIKL
jgi:predicted DNA-binding protein with PD1-like motif